MSLGFCQSWPCRAPALQFENRDKLIVIAAPARVRRFVRAFLTQIQRCACRESCTVARELTASGVPASKGTRHTGIERANSTRAACLARRAGAPRPNVRRGMEGVLAERALSARRRVTDDSGAASPRATRCR